MRFRKTIGLTIALVGIAPAVQTALAQENRPIQLASLSCPAAAGDQFQGDEVDFVRGGLCPLNRSCSALFDRVVTSAGLIIDITGAGVAPKDVNRELVDRVGAFDNALQDIGSFASRTNFSGADWGRQRGVADRWGADFKRIRADLGRAKTGLRPGIPLTAAKRDEIGRVAQAAKKVERGNCRA